MTEDIWDLEISAVPSSNDQTSLLREVGAICVTINADFSKYLTPEWATHLKKQLLYLRVQ